MASLTGGVTATPPLPQKVESRRRYYHCNRPHGALGNLFYGEFAALAETADCPSKLALSLLEKPGQDQGV